MKRTVDASAARGTDVVTAIRWCALSVGWALLGGVTSLLAGLAADSTALVGFGLNSMVDGTASAILVWRFRHERLGARPSGELERRAAELVGVVLLLIAVYLAARASSALAGRSRPEPSSLGVALTGASMLVLPFLATAKLRLARRLESHALHADGVLSGAGAALAAATVMALALNTTLEWWWADPVASLVIAATLLLEGTRTVRSARRV
jgi:divalent metal cation (Fe/Co/Zn/Cd) transporter